MLVARGSYDRGSTFGFDPAGSGRREPDLGPRRGAFPGLIAVTDRPKHRPSEASTSHWRPPASRRDHPDPFCWTWCSRWLGDHRGRMVDELSIMIAAVVLALVLMMFTDRWIERIRESTAPTGKISPCSFLVLIASQPDRGRLRLRFAKRFIYGRSRSPCLLRRSICPTNPAGKRTSSPNRAGASAGVVHLPPGHASR